MAFNIKLNTIIYIKNMFKNKVNHIPLDVFETNK